MRSIIGWDIGGAHLKGVRVAGARVVAVDQRACRLWLGPEHLAAALAEARAALRPADLEVATMTGELAECFTTRAAGVAAIAALALPADGLIYSVRGFVGPAHAAAVWEAVASANWHATAAFVAAAVSDGLLVDIGSTTSDLVPFRGGKVAMRGVTDAARLGCGELVYTGVARTSLQALSGHAYFDGQRQRIAAENFAESADIYRLTGELATADDHYPASDGRSKSPADARARLARMLGRDAGGAGDEVWHGVAAFFRQRQLGQLADAAFQVLSGAGLPRDAPLIACGAGAFLVPELAARLGRPWRALAGLIPADDALRHAASVAAPATAVALLADAR